MLASGRAGSAALAAAPVVGRGEQEGSAGGSRKTQSGWSLGGEGTGTVQSTCTLSPEVDTGRPPRRVDGRARSCHGRNARLTAHDTEEPGSTGGECGQAQRSRWASVRPGLASCPEQARPETEQAPEREVTAVRTGLLPGCGPCSGPPVTSWEPGAARGWRLVTRPVRDEAGRCDVGSSVG